MQNVNIIIAWALLMQNVNIIIALALLIQNVYTHYTILSLFRPFSFVCRVNTARRNFS
jgi:hypothetical protein